MSRCRAIYLVLAEQPELDRLEKCNREATFAPRPGHLDHCDEHRSQLDWVRSNPGRLAAYNEQVHLYDISQQLAAQAEQEAQERAAREAAAAAPVEQESLL